MRTLWLCMLLILFAAPASAGVCSLTVTVTPTAVAFGNYSANSATDNHSNGGVTVACLVQSGNTLPSFSVALSKGNGSLTTRQMNFLTATLNYNLYTTGAYTTVWGDGTSSTATQSYSSGSNLATKSLTIFGSIPTHQYVANGLYGDTITITVTY